MSENCVIPKHFAKNQCACKRLAKIALNRLGLHSNHFGHHALQQVLNTGL